METLFRFYRPTFYCETRFTPVFWSALPARSSAFFLYCGGWCSWEWRCRRFHQRALPSHYRAPSGLDPVRRSQFA